MGVVSILSVVLNVCRGNRNTSFAFLWSFVDCTICEEVGEALFCLSFGYRSGEGGLAMVNVTNCACFF